MREATDIAQRGLTAADRKYMQASAMAISEGKRAYRDTLRRLGKGR